MRGIARFCEDDKKRISRRINLLGLRKPRDEPANDLVMALDQFDSSAIAENLLKASGALDIGKEHRHQFDSMLLTEGFDTRAAFLGIDCLHRKARLRQAMSTRQVRALGSAEF